MEHFLNKHTVILVICAILLNGTFLYIYRKNIFFEGLLRHHGEIAYNLYAYNSIKINTKRIGAISAHEAKTKRRADYCEIDHEAYGPPTQYRNYFDSIGYGIIIGLLWKLTHSLHFFDIQLLQLLLFCLLLLLFYQIAFMLFDKRTALFSCIALLLFFPVTYLNVQVARDIWPFYAAVILCYTILSYLKRRSLYVPIIGGTCVALLQFMRPPTFMLILTTGTVLLFYMILSKSYKPVMTLLCTLILTNILFFWLPFMAYNKVAYDRYVVGPSGINLMCGLGEFENPWGYKLSDGFYADFMNEHYPNLNDVQKDDKARELFYKAFKERPWFYVSCLLKRIPRLILPGLPWFNYQDTKGIYKMYLEGMPLKNIIRFIIREPMTLFDFAARHIYIGLFLFLAYLGMLMMLIRRKFFALSLLFLGIIAASYTVIFAHTDHRYLTPYYAFFAICVGYLCSQYRRPS